jgi:hypothetical protein
LEYATTKPNRRTPIIVSLVIPGNPFPVTEHPFVYEADGTLKKEKITSVVDPDGTQKKENFRNVVDSNGYCGKAIHNGGYQSHYTIGRKRTTPFLSSFWVLTLFNYLIAYSSEQDRHDRSLPDFREEGSITPKS